MDPAELLVRLVELLVEPHLPVADLAVLPAPLAPKEAAAPPAILALVVLEVVAPALAEAAEVAPAILLVLRAQAEAELEYLVKVAAVQLAQQPQAVWQLRVEVAVAVLLVEMLLLTDR